MDDTSVKARLSDLHAVGLTLWGEARGEEVDGLAAVGNVIRNRKIAKRVPSWKAIVHQKAQFSCWSPVGGTGEQTNYQRLMGMARSLLAGQAASDPEVVRCLVVAQLLFSGVLVDNTFGSRHYLTTALFRSAPPLWAKGKTPTVQIGAHVFFAGLQ